MEMQTRDYRVTLWHRDTRLGASGERHMIKYEDWMGRMNTDATMELAARLLLKKWMLPDHETFVHVDEVFPDGDSVSVLSLGYFGHGAVSIRFERF